MPKFQREVTVPRFVGDASSPAASRAKQRTPRRDTTPERALRRELWRRGLRYRLHGRGIRGVPDIVFARQRLLVFCDGDFWHGRDWAVRRKRLERGSNGPYWIAKIEANMRRDETTTSVLIASGWRVIRVWEGDIMRDASAVAETIAALLGR